MPRLIIKDIAQHRGALEDKVEQAPDRAAEVSAATRDRIAQSDAGPREAPVRPTRTWPAPHGLLVVLAHDGSDPFALQVAQAGAETALGDGEHALAVQRIPSGDAGADRLLAFIRAHRPSGLLLLPPLCDDAAIIAAARTTDCRVIGVGAGRSGPDALCAAERAGTAAAVTALVGLGHSRIAMITGPEESATEQQRELGYLDALAENHLDRGPALIASGDCSLPSGREAARLLLEVSPRPTAILVSGDAMAAGALHAAQEAGIAVPAQLSIVSIGDSPLARTGWPPMSSVSVPLGAMARAGASAVVSPDPFARLERDWPAPFIERGSSGPAPA